MVDSQPSLLDDWAKKIADHLPGGLKTVQHDFEKNSRAWLQANLSKLNLVTREEFEVQQAVLARTRQQLIVLEQKVVVLEQRLAALESGDLAVKS